MADILADALHAEQAADWDGAMACYEAALRRFPREPGAAAPADLLRRIGVLHRERGEQDLAREALEAALDLAAAENDDAMSAAVLNDLGGTELRAGRLEAAERVYARTAELARRTGNERLAGVVEQNLATVATIRGDAGTALALYGRALETLLRAGDPRSAAMVLNNIGMAHVDRGELEQAEAAYDRAFRLGQGEDDRRTLAFVELNRAELHLKRGDLARARESVDLAYGAVEMMGSRWRLSTAHRFYGVLDREAGDLDSSERHLRRAVELAREAGDRLREAEAAAELAATLLWGGSSGPALRLLNRSHRLFTELGARREIADLDRRLDGLEATYLAVVRQWGDSIESVDRYTAGHCERVADLACELARAVGFSGRDLAWIRMGAFLHDVGKTAVPAEILNKAGPLTPDEWEVMRAHTVAGAQIVAELEFPWEIGPLVRNHHEHWDGTGYPDGLAGEEIPLTARILGVADCFDALTSARSYRPAMPADRALQEMAATAGTVLDPRLVSVFSSLRQT